MMGGTMTAMKNLQEQDPEIYAQVQGELYRLQTELQMIPSENYASKAVLQACGTVLNNKYSEGYPKRRYYQGNQFTDNVEQLAIDRAKKIFGAEHVNVQPDSGSIANMAIYNAVLSPKDKIMGLRLDMGGHLTHGHIVSATAKFFTPVQYSVDQETELIDLDLVRKMAEKERPKIIVSGATAYPRTFNFKEFHEIAESVGAYSMADISHIAGLIAGKAHPSPFPFTDLVMTTTHKTLRGPRGAIILSKKEDRLVDISGTQYIGMNEKQLLREKDLAGKIDRSIFPGLQGGPHEHIIAAKAVAFKEALSEDFQDYAHQIVKNAQTLASSLMDHGIKLVTNGTDNHLILIDLRSFGIGLGKPAAVALEEAGFCTNCNTVPYDPSTPFKPSGVRIGTPAMTTRGMKESEMKQIGEWMARVLKDMNNAELKKKIKQDVHEMCREFPIYEDL